MFKPVTSRLDTQIEATKKLNNKGLKELDPLPEFPIDEDEDEDEMPNYPPPTPIDEAQTEDEYEMPDFDPPPPIDEAQTEDEDEMPDFDPPPSIEQKRKKWDTSANQKELDRQRESLAEERRQVSVLLGKLKKSGKNMIKSGKYKGKSYNDLLEIDEDFTNQIDRIENQLLLTKHKIQRMEYKRVPFSASDLQEKSKKLKKTPKKTKYKKKPTIEESLFDKIDAMRRDTAPDSDREDDEWEGGGLANNYKAIYYRDPEKLIEKLDVICGSINAGNTSYELKNQGKAVVIERFNRTLKNKMYKQFTIQGNTQYLEMLPILVKEYNNTKHSSIKMTPTEASKEKNQGIVYLNLYGDMEPLSAKPKFKEFVMDALMFICLPLDATSYEGDRPGFHYTNPDLFSDTPEKERNIDEFCPRAKFEGAVKKVGPIQVKEKEVSGEDGCVKKSVFDENNTLNKLAANVVEIVERYRGRAQKGNGNLI
ncbi:hypothetical protein ACROYT_G024760 [Oculina patagonica]